MTQATEMLPVIERIASLETALLKVTEQAIKLQAELRECDGRAALYAERFTYTLDHFRPLVAHLESEVRHWKGNHANMVERARLLSERPDLPVDRIPAFARMGGLVQEVADLTNDNARLRLALKTIRDKTHTTAVQLRGIANEAL